MKASEAGPLHFTGRPQQEIQLAIAWNQMPHRRVLLRDLVPRLLFENADTQAYLKESAADWEKTQAQGAEDEKEKLHVVPCPVPT